ncbi:hypothetical protein PC116_g28490 [Phytophthora cactorum]|nr:hypothetical protein PC116_g28490 [Phytophthora cactorum]
MSGVSIGIKQSPYIGADVDTSLLGRTTTATWTLAGE